MSSSINFIVWAYPFDDRSGGVIALHLLSQRLLEAGESSVLWPIDRPKWTSPIDLRQGARWISYHLLGRRQPFNRGPFQTQLATFGDFHRPIAIYPEVTAGNPLGTKNVVRWLLHRPGFHTGQATFGDEDLVFYYQDAFYDPATLRSAAHRLTLTWWNQEYFNRGSSHREGSAYLLKKGADRGRQHDTTNSILIDDLSHAEKARVFNSCKYFYTYDPYTLYSRYAAICGCIPVVVPVPGLPEEQWVPCEEERYGLAYGVDRIPWAVETRDRLIERIAQERHEEDVMLANFIERCYANYAPA